MASEHANATLDLIARRTSTRVFSPEPITPAEKDAIFSAAFRAPTAGNLMLYSIVDVTDQALKDRLAVTCDDQPFIAKAPLVAVFVADWQRWIDMFDAAGVAHLQVAHPRTTPALADLMLAISDALIAAQNAVIAAESLGIGSCYIGDILENAETHAELLGLPPYTLPIAMVVFGRPLKSREPVARFSAHVVHENRYVRLTPEQIAADSAAMAAEYTPHGLPEGIDDYAQVIYRRKFTSEFMAEMNRSVAWWLERWQSPSGE